VSFIEIRTRVRAKVAHSGRFSEGLACAGEHWARPGPARSRPKAVRIAGPRIAAQPPSNATARARTRTHVYPPTRAAALARAEATREHDHRIGPDAAQ